MLDVETNFSTIISASHQRSEMYTVVRDKATLAPRRTITTKLVVGITAAAAVVVTMVTVVATIVIGYFVNRWYKQHNVR